MIALIQAVVTLNSVRLTDLKRDEKKLILVAGKQCII